MDAEMDAECLRHRPDGADLLGLELRLDEGPVVVTGRVLEVHTDRPGLQHAATRLAHLARASPITHLDVRAHREPSGPDNARDGGEHLVARDVLTVGVAQAVGDARARGREGLEALAFEDDGAARVPDAADDEDVRSVVKAEKPLGSFALGRLVHGCSSGTPPDVMSIRSSPLDTLVPDMR